MKGKKMREKMFQHCPDIFEWKFLITCKNMTHYFGTAESFLQGRQKFIYRKKKKNASKCKFFLSNFRRKCKTGTYTAPTNCTGISNWFPVN